MRCERCYLKSRRCLDLDPIRVDEFDARSNLLGDRYRCLGQGLHTLEEFGAHSNYVELSLRELGFHNVFAHTGTNTIMHLRGKQVFPLVTGTFGMVDFYLSVLGEAADHFTESEVNEMDNALGAAQTAAQSSHSTDSSRSRSTRRYRDPKAE